ncbi:MAG: ABC transporter ATP-binding protein [Acidimicrobiia bacterium]|nr:ABC transporter ATP-binding protein [Acidimicrobiia bacterium]
MRLSCTGLGAGFESNGGRVLALRQLNLRTREREFLSIVGPSGCGKTTLLRILAGLLKPSDGEVERIGGDGECVRMVRQENSLFPWMTVLENAAFGLEMEGFGKAEREARALALLAKFGVTGRERAYPHELSLGMKQRVALCRCFLSNPELMLMDEPFAALDAQSRASLQQELLALWQEAPKSVVFVTHDVEEAILMSDRVLVLSAQPGTVIGEFGVGFSRPRTQETTVDPEFIQIKRDIWRLLGMETRDVAHAV